MRDYVVKYEDLYRVTKAMFLALGYSEQQATTVTECLTEADLRHKHSHGTVAIWTYVEHLKEGNLHLDAPEPTTVFETPLSLVLDGHSGVGYCIADYAVKKTIEKAKKTGVCITTVRQANHYGFAAHWTEMMAQEGLIGISATNTVRCVCPTRSAERNLGTDPMTFAFPTAGDEPMFNLDMATCVMAHGKLVRSQVFAESGVVPREVIIDGKGNVVTDFKEAIDILDNGDDRSYAPKPDTGGLVPLGGVTEILSGHKGYGLAMVVELLTGGLSGGVPSKFIPLRHEGICFFFMAIDPALFGDPQAVREHIKYIINEYRATAALDPSLPVIMPGDKSRAARAKALESGIELSPEIIDVLREIADKTDQREQLEAILKYN
ncbi:MAG: Ldh family oxidoreductase [bacterium]|nr:Ldh family oxidoreductase [bacterium]